MHWVVQQNLLSPVTFGALQVALESRAVPYTAVRLIPFLNLLSPDIELDAPDVFVYGSTGLGVVAKAKGWLPGYTDANLDYSLYLQHYGHEMLNADAVVLPLGQLERIWDRFFIRPTSDGKQFAGEVMSWEQLDVFRNGVRDVADDEGVTLTLNDCVAMASCKTIFAEYRFFVFDGEVVTGSRYKVGEIVESSTSIPASVRQYVQQQVRRWQPNRAFAIDVADTTEGLKIIELNSAHSAGFYAADLGRIVDAVEAMVSG
jgi:hypothetical protein